MSYLYVKWNSLRAACSPAVQTLDYVLGLPGHSRNSGLRRRRRSAQAAVEGVAGVGSVLHLDLMPGGDLPTARACDCN
jgi:hypothetical protein